MTHSSDLDAPSDETCATQPGAVFGFEDYWPKFYAKFERQFGAIRDLINLGNAIIGEAEARASKPARNVICFLARATMAGGCEAILLCGNGCGSGAMKIVRGMYESRWTAEYLRRHPEEVEDYLEFGKVMLWRRVQWSKENTPGLVTDEVAKEVENEFNKVKGRFTNASGGMRPQWSKKSIRAIADDIGRQQEYELPYSMACSIHHANFEGLLSLFDLDDESAMPQPPPSDSWVGDALRAAHANLCFAFVTLNESCDRKFQQQIDGANRTFVEVWGKQDATLPDGS